MRTSYPMRLMTKRASGFGSISATSTGVAASAKEKYKQNKYNPLAQRVGGKFIPAIIERFGAFGDADRKSTRLNSSH